MRGRVRHFMTVFLTTFLFVNFVVGSILYAFASNQMSPVPDPATMSLIAVVIAILALVDVVREG